MSFERRVSFSVTNASSTVSDGNTTVTGHQLLPMAGETLAYDADGNQSGDSIWTNYWDAENRLVKTEIYATNLPAEAKVREEWSYLPDGRWIQRIVSTKSETATNSKACASRFNHESGAASWSSRPCHAAGAPSLVFIRTPQHTGHPHPVLSS